MKFSLVRNLNKWIYLYVSATTIGKLFRSYLILYFSISSMYQTVHIKLFNKVINKQINKRKKLNYVKLSHGKEFSFGSSDLLIALS